MHAIFDDLTTGRIILLLACIFIAFGFEFVNGFHDTANAVATVIYTHSLPPRVAVVLSGICNFTGVFVGGIAVAMGIIKLLPVELLVSSGPGAGLAMVLALLVAAILWNLGTWCLGLPASSSHTLIGAILGVGLANSMLPGHVFGDGVNWDKAEEIGASLLLSPLVGFGLAAPSCSSSSGAPTTSPPERTRSSSSPRPARSRLPSAPARSSCSTCSRRELLPRQQRRAEGRRHRDADPHGPGPGGLRARPRRPRR